MALTAYIVFLFFAIIGRVILQYRLTGDHGFRSVTSQASFFTKLSSILLLASFLSSFTLTAIEQLKVIQPQINLGILGTLLGIIFCLVGIVTALAAQYQMGTAWRIGVDENEKTKLVTHGLYAKVRNPIYSGVILFGLGLLLFIPHIYMLMSLYLGYISIDLQVRFTEEPYLVRLHGVTFNNYANTINRYFPKMSLRN